MSPELETVQRVLAEGDEHLGDLCWWSLQDARIERVSLEQVWANAGLDESLLPEEPNPERSLRAAVKESGAGLGDRLIRLGKEDEQELVFAIVREHKEADGSVSFTQEARIILDRQGRRLWSDVPHQDVFVAVQERYQSLLTSHTSCEVRRTVLRALKSFAAVSLREHGGVYWIPRQFSTHLRQLQSAVEQIGTSRFHLLPVHDSEEAGMELSEVAKGSLETELESLRHELEEFAACPPDRPSTLARRFETYEGLRQRAQLYQGVLRMEMGELDAALDKLTTQLENLLESKAQEAAA